MNGQWTLQKNVVCLGVMLICFGGRLTIKASFTLDKKHTLPQFPSLPPSISPSPSFSSPSPCTTGLALPHWFSFTPSPPSSFEADLVLPQSPFPRQET
jgi:hypothetical protein